MPLKSLYDFVTQDVSLQTQSNFEFRYPILFKEDSFLINQIDWPNVELNQGNVYIDGYAIPVFSSPKYGTEIKFSMYVPEPFFTKYTEIFNAIINKSDNITENDNNSVRYYAEQLFSSPYAEIIPLNPEISRTMTGDFVTSLFKSNSLLPSSLKLVNARIKSLSMNSGFTANSIALAMFDVTMTFSYFEITEDYREGQKWL